MFETFIYFGIYLLVTSLIVAVGVYSYSGIDGKRDMRFENINAAIAVSMAGFFGGVTFILMNAFAGTTHGSLVYDFAETLAYAVVGMLILMASKKILDKIVFADIDFKKELFNNNVLVAAREAAGSVATGIAVFSALYWVDFSADGGIPVGLFVIALVFLSMMVFSYILRPKKTVDYTISADDEGYASAVSIVVENATSVIAMALSLGVGFGISHSLGLNTLLSVAIAPVIGFVFMVVVYKLASFVGKKVFAGTSIGDTSSRAVIKMAFFVPSLMFFM